MRVGVTRLLCVVFTLGAAPSMHAAEGPPPIDVFAALPAVSPVTISPDGRAIAFVANRNGVRVLTKVDLETGTERRVLSDTQGGPDLEECLWGSSTHLLCTEGELYRAPRSQPRRPLEYYASPFASRLWWVDADPDAEAKVRIRTLDTWGSFPDQIVGRSEEAGSAQVMLTLSDGAGRATLNSLDLTTGVVNKVVRKPQSMSFYFGGAADGSFIGLGLARDTPRRIFEFSPGGDMARELTKDWTSTEAARTPLGYNSDGTRVYAIQRGSQTENLWALDPAGKDPPRIIASDPGLADADFLFVDPRRIYGASVFTDRRKAFYFDPRYASAAALIDKALPGRFNAITGSSRDAQRMVVHSISDTRPDEYFLFDRKKAALTLIASEYPRLESAVLGSTELVHIEARDGAKISGFVTTPPGAASKSALPLIVVPAGIYTRQVWGFGWQEQFLATRGYAVLEVNNRGSEALGRQWADAGKQDVGLAYGDVIDSVRWAVDRGIADPKRVCLYGAHYSGNLALIAAMKSPDLFQAVATFGAITDMAEHLTTRVSSMRDALGSRANIREFSPIRMAKDAPPSLLVHARKDRVSRSIQGINMNAALERAGREHQLLLLDGATEELNRPSDRRLLLSSLDKFFAKHCK